jgi:spermidine synthase
MTFGLVLASWLLWGGMGSMIASKFELRHSNFPKIYYGVVVAFPLCLAGLRFSRFLLGTLPGEITGMLTILPFALVLSFFISVPLGALFVFNAQIENGNVTRVYLLESLGAAVSGLIVYLLLVPYFSNWQGMVLVGLLSSIAIFFTFGGKKNTVLFFIVVLVLIGSSLFDLPSQKIYWKPFRLLESKDSPYGKLQVIKTEEQVTLYNNSLQVYSYPDLAAAEESVHFALLQNPKAHQTLLIGGGMGGSLRQALKYPQVEVDYVEIDPDIIRLSAQFLPQEEQSILTNERVHIFYMDGRAFLNTAPKTYDVIILNLPEPATAQINRFYTEEFFLKVKEKLRENGIFSFRVPSAENYIGPELRQFLGSLYFTLKKVFPNVQVVPGDTNVFLASASPLSIQYEDLSQRIKELGLKNSYVSPELLFDRLNPLRINRWLENVQNAEKNLNQDLHPLSYFFNSVLWSTQFKGAETKILTFFSKLHSFWLLDFPLLLFVTFLFFLWLKRYKESFSLIPLAVMGFTTIITEIIILIWFQTIFGYVYSRISLLLTMFMFGLFVGSLRSLHRKKTDFLQMITIQSGFIILLFILNFSLRVPLPKFFLFAFLFLLGFLGGDLFVVSNHLFLKEKKNYGLGYGLDLTGSFLGALVASSILIPLVGLLPLLRYLLLLNSFCLLFVLAKPKNI